MPSLFMCEPLLMRKKFFILCGRSLDSLVCLEVFERLEKFRFSFFVSVAVDVWDELNNCVILG